MVCKIKDSEARAITVHRLTMEVDTGTTVSIISEQTQKMFSQMPC